MKIKNLKFQITLTLLTILALIHPQTAHSQTPSRTISLSPPHVELTLNPGETKGGTLRITNKSNQTLSFTSNTQDFIVEDKQGTPKILPHGALPTKYSAADWISIFPSQFILAPNQTQEVTFTIATPIYARPGGHYAAVLFKNFSVSSGEGAAVASELGSLFLITVPGNIVEQANITKFETKKLSEYGPVKLEILINNQSDIHIKPSGTITLKNIFGGVVEEKKLDEQNIFPGASRDYTTKLGNKFMLGFYRTEFSLTSPTSLTPLTSTTSFWVIPWKTGLIILLVSLSLFFSFRLLKSLKLLR